MIEVNTIPAFYMDMKLKLRKYIYM